MSVQKDELHRLIDALPEKEIATAKRFLEFLAIQPDEESWDEFLKNPPIDDEPLTEYDLLDIKEGEKAIAEGRVKSWEQIKREYGL
jgi:hypothetical protein